MEVPNVRPKQRSTSPHVIPGRGESEELVEENDATIVEALVKEFTQLNVEISNQQEELQSKRDSVEECKNTTKQRVNDVFAELKQLLERKERETLNVVDEHFNNAGLSELESSIDIINAEKSQIKKILKNNGEQIRTCGLDKTNTSLTRLKRYRNRRDRILSANYESTVAINEDIEEISEVLQRWKCIPADNGNRAPLQLQEDNSDNVAINSLPSISHESEALTDDQHGNEENRDEVDRTVNANGAALYPSEDNDDTRLIGNEERGAHARMGTPTNASSETIVQPTAPPLSNPGSSEEEHEKPPPYWEAIGLSGPQAGLAPMNASMIPNPNTRSYQNAAPRYFDVVSSMDDTRNPGRQANKLEHWHSFPSKRQFDHRSTFPVALSWNHGRICLGDRGNRKVKFFNCSGKMLGEMLFNGEIHDVAFLEMSNYEFRYIVSLAKVNTFCIIALQSDNTTKFVRSIALRHSIPYNCISRGPIEQTLVGGSGLPSNNQPCVDLIEFDGRVLHRFKFTPELVPFGYPKSVAVCNQFIIISDYKLNVVCVFCSDGSPVGQYTGTPTSPLIDPLDITVDCFGNVMILHGKCPTVHVMNIKCSPIEVIEIPVESHELQSTKHMTFDIETNMLATTKSSGQITVYSFRQGYTGVRQGDIPDPITERREPAVLPLIEGMLPSTIENMRSRPPRPRGRTGQFHL